MNYSARLATFSLALLLLTSPEIASATTIDPSSPPVENATKVDALSAPAAKKIKSRKAKPQYSKATLSVFEPISATAIPTPEPGRSLGTGMVAKPSVDDLLGAQPLQDVDSGSYAGMTFARPSLLATDELPPQNYDVNPDDSQLAAGAAVAGPNALGSDSISVIDRFADKPKSTPIAQGPVRVKVRDSAVGAWVKIPLEPR